MTQMELRAVQDADMQSTAAVSTRADSSLNAEAIAPRRFAGRSQTAGRSREIRSTSPLARRKELAEERVRSLVTQARAGDDRAFEQLVKCYQSRIHSHVARMTQDPAEAEDLAQETFLRAYQALPHFRGDATFGTWLYRIASNLAIDAARHRRRREWQTVSLDEPIEAEEHTTAWDLADGGQRTPAETLESAALRGHVWDAIAELSPKLRSPIILYDLQGLTLRGDSRDPGLPARHRQEPPVQRPLPTAGQVAPTSSGGIPRRSGRTEPVRGVRDHHHLETTALEGSLVLHHCRGAIRWVACQASSAPMPFLSGAAWRKTPGRCSPPRS